MSRGPDRSVCRTADQVQVIVMTTLSWST